MDLSIIIPGCNEFAQNAFTIQGLNACIGDELDYEIIYIENRDYKLDELQTVDDMVKYPIPQGVNSKDKKHPERESLWGAFTPEQRLAVMQFIAFWQQGTQGLSGAPNVNYLRYDDQLSHWQAKNVGLAAAQADTVLFLDAHVLLPPGAIPRMFRHYREHKDALHGSLHLPVTYMNDRKYKKHVYCLKWGPHKGIYHYKYRGMTERDHVHTVPCMSTCGMMVEKQIIQEVLGCWPETMGIYGGGENYMNAAMAVTGHKINIWPFDCTYHFAYHRVYHWNYDDYLKNRMTALYVALGEDWLKLFWADRAKKDNPEVLKKIAGLVMEKNRGHRKLIEGNQRVLIEDWFQQQPAEYTFKEP